MPSLLQHTEALRQSWSRFTQRANGSRLSAALATTAPLDLRIMGRVVFHAAVVGIAAGLMGSAFFAALEYTQRFLLEDLAGYVPLRAYGEAFAQSEGKHVFRPWLLVIMPAIGGLLCGLVVLLAREAKGGGGDAVIEAFHHRNGTLRRRVIWVKALASLFTLGTGGAGGREGPTMLIGGSLGTLVARTLRVTPRERRILLVAGIAAGISAIFRTPLGAALFAVEVLYKDGFESDALIPAVLSSVVGYSVVIAIFGETTLFGQVIRFPLVLSHLPLYALLAIVVSAAGGLFVKSLRVSRRFFSNLPVPVWARPAVGGLALGLFTTPIVVYVGKHIGIEGQGLGLLGGGYGAVQMAISGSSWLPGGWFGVELLLMLALAKLFASALTIGSEGSAGDFAPSLAIGGLLGGAYGRTLELLLDDPQIHPGAFALVGMGVLYGGIAHVPLSALIFVCELAGNYDLLVPLMLALGISFVVIRKVSLYDAQVPTQTDSPVHRNAFLFEVLTGVRVRDVLPAPRQFAVFSPQSTTQEMLQVVASTDWQEVFPVVDGDKGLVGVVTSGTLRVLANENEQVEWLLATDLMQPPVSISLDQDLRVASQQLVSNGLREIPVTDSTGQLIALLDEMDVTHWQVDASACSTKTPLPISRPRWDVPLR